MDQVDSLLADLKKILVNLKKNPNRRYMRATLLNKLNQSRIYYNEILDLIDLFGKTNQNFFLKSARLLYGEIKTLIDSKLDRNHLISFKTLAKVSLSFLHLHKRNMANPKVDVKLGTTLIQMYDGAPQHLDAFIDSVNLFNDTVQSDFAAATAAQKQTAQVTVVKLVKSRLTGVARQVIAGADDLQGIIDAVKQHCESKITSDNVLAKLKATRQKDSIETFCNEVETLTTQLKSCYVREEIPANRANTMATKKGVEALISGSKNTDTKLILKAGTFNKINDAIQKVMENNETTSNNNSPATNAQILTGRVSHPRGRGTNHRGRGNYSNFYQHDRHVRYQNSPHNRGNFTNQRGHWSHRGNFSNQRGNWTQRGRYPPNMFLAHQGGVQYQLPAHQAIQMPLHPHIQMPQQQHIPQSTNGNIHPLGVQLGQHIQ